MSVKKKGTVVNPLHLNNTPNHIGKIQILCNMQVCKQLNNNLAQNIKNHVTQINLKELALFQALQYKSTKPVMSA
jgi:hypothetical protein